MTTYTDSQMLSLWMDRLDLNPIHTGCSIQTVEGLDTESEIRRRMRQWYLNLLDTAPPSLLPVSENAMGTALSSEGLFYRVALPEATRRVVSVKAQGWLAAVAPLSADEAAARLGRIASPFGRPGNNSPLAVYSDGALLVTPVNIPALDSLRLVLDPGPTVYTLDDSLLSTIPTDL